ncbi:MAG: hypothetical protein WCI18_11610 [Pseudomonadota bacterium]
MTNFYSLLGGLRIYASLILFIFSVSCRTQNSSENSNLEKSQAASEQRICVFLHGAGENAPPEKVGLHAEPKQSWSFPFGDYWGTKRDKDGHYVMGWHKVKCTQFLYGDFPTKFQTWRDDKVLKAYANFAMGKDKNGVSMTGGVYPHNVFAHSMGNNILANAIRRGFLPSDFQFYAIQGPFLGSPAAYYLAQGCTPCHPLAKLASIFSACMDEKDVKNEDHGSEPIDLRTEATKDLDPRTAPGNNVKETLASGILAKLVSTHTAGVHCSTSPMGLHHPLISVLLGTLSEMVYRTGDVKAYEKLGFTDTTNDGMVPIQSCKAGAPANAKWGNDSSSAFYISDLSHYEGAGRNGEVSSECSENHVGARSKCAIDWIAKRVADNSMAFKRSGLSYQ